MTKHPKVSGDYDPLTYFGTHGKKLEQNEKDE